MQALWHAVRRCQTSIIFICSCATSSAASSLRCVSCRCLCRRLPQLWLKRRGPSTTLTFEAFACNCKVRLFLLVYTIFLSFFLNCRQCQQLSRGFSSLSLSLPPSLPNANANTIAATDGFHNSLPFACPMPLHHASVLQLKCQTAYLTWLSLGDIGMQKQTETTTTNETHMQQKPNNLLHKMLVLFSFGI